MTVNVLLKPGTRPGYSYLPTDPLGWLWIGQFADVKDARKFGKRNRWRGRVRYRATRN